MEGQFLESTAFLRTCHPGQAIRRVWRTIWRLSKAPEWIGHFLTERYEGIWDVSSRCLDPGSRSIPPSLRRARDEGIRGRARARVLSLVPRNHRFIRRGGAGRQVVAAHARLGAARAHRPRTPATTARCACIPVVTNPDVMFLLNGTRVVMDAGSVWVLRLNDPHSVANRGPTDRVHMLVDTVMDGGWKRCCGPRVDFLSLREKENHGFGLSSAAETALHPSDKLRMSRGLIKRVNPHQPLTLRAFSGRTGSSSVVMAALVAAIHSHSYAVSVWMAGTSPAMTILAFQLDRKTL